MTQQKTNEHDQKLYQTWDQHWVEEPKLTLVGKIFCPMRMKVIREEVSKLKIKNAIDVGCGMGYQLKLLAEMGIDAEGIDVAPESIQVCKQKGLKVNIADVGEINKKYDLVAAEGMLEHFLDFTPHAKAMMNISNKYVLLMQPNHDSKTGLTLAYLTRILRGDKCVFEYNFKMSDYISVFEKNNFKCIRNRPLIADTSRILIFERIK